MLRLAEIVKLFNVGRYADAIPLAQLELAIYEKVLGPNHLDVATSLNTLAFFYEKQGRYADADPFYKRAAAIREKALGPDDPFVGSLLPLQKRALAISEKAYGPNDPAVALRLYSLASTYFNQGRYADAALVQTRSGNMRESVWSRSSQRRGVPEQSRHFIYDQGRYADAEPLYKRSLAIREKALGPNHPDVATSLNNMGLLYERQGQYAEAEPLYKRALFTNQPLPVLLPRTSKN